VIEIAIDIRMIEFYAGQDNIAGAVVEKLRSLVKKSRVVLVTFNDHVIACPDFPSAAEIHRHPADEKSRLQPGARPCPGGQSGRSGLSVRAGDYQRRARANQKPAQRLWK